MADLDAALASADRLCPKCERVPTEPGDLCPTCGCRLVELGPDAGLIGAVVDGRFEIRGLLGEGGMGTVYRAWQRSVGREVAIKVIDRKKVRDAMTVRRFLREAKLASQLSHPNTVHVIDFGQGEDRQLFIAMELVRGKTLADAVAATGGLGLVRAVGIAIQLCDALEAAHGLAIVHRDLKPANVILVDDPSGRDRIKVLDFGLAKSLVADDTETTQTGDIVGTPRYLAPELTMGEVATPRSDLYAVGVMLVELCIGRRLFDGSRMVDMMRQKAVDPQVPAEVPPPLAAIIARLIDPEPRRRPASAAALRAELQACLDGADGATPAEPATPTPPRLEPTRATGPVRFGADATAVTTSEDTAVSAVIAPDAPDAPRAVAAASEPVTRRRRHRWMAMVAAIAGLGVAAAIASTQLGGSSGSTPAPIAPGSAEALAPVGSATPAPPVAAPPVAPVVNASPPSTIATPPAPEPAPGAAPARSHRGDRRRVPGPVKPVATPPVASPPVAPIPVAPPKPAPTTTPGDELPF